MKVRNKPVYNFVFGSVLGKKAVFLIQNIFPTIEKYIKEKYQVRNNDVTISMPLQKEIIEKAECVLKLEEKNIHVAFSNLIDFREELLNNH